MGRCVGPKRNGRSSSRSTRFVPSSAPLILLVINNAFLNLITGLEVVDSSLRFVEFFSPFLLVVTELTTLIDKLGV